MAVKFECEKCGAEIVVKYARPGDEVPCRRCGAHVAVPGPDEIEKGTAHAFELRCDRCGKAVDAAGLKPGESAPCPSCGAAVTFPDYSEAEKERRLGRFVRCPACGSYKIEVIVFWGLHWLAISALERYTGTVPVKCKKCGAKYDGRTGRSIEQELYYFRKTQRFHLVLFAIFGLLLVVVIIFKATGWL